MIFSDDIYEHLDELSYLNSRGTDRFLNKFFEGYKKDPFFDLVKFMLIYDWKKRPTIEEISDYVDTVLFKEISDQKYTIKELEKEDFNLEGKMSVKTKLLPKFFSI